MSEKMRSSKKRRNNNLQPTLPQGNDEQQIVNIHQAWQGPLPPPSILADFNEIIGNGAERIVAQWEQETKHRRDYEQRALRGRICIDLTGRIMAFIFAMAALGVTTYAASIGQPWVATVLGGGTIAAVAAALVYRRGGENVSSSERPAPSPKR